MTVCVVLAFIPTIKAELEIYGIYCVMDAGYKIPVNRPPADKDGKTPVMPYKGL